MRRCGEGEHSHARALEILGAGLESVLPLGESRPASVEERLSGVAASMRNSVMLRGRLGAKVLVGEKSGKAEGVDSRCALIL